MMQKGQMSVSPMKKSFIVIVSFANTTVLTSLTFWEVLLVSFLFS